MSESDQDRSKRLVAERALHFVENGMRLGLGSGSTARIFVDLLARRASAEGLSLRCVPTSEATRRQAEGLGLDVLTLDDLPELDLTIDGADEYDPDLTLIKGGGGALLREKIVATASRRMIVVADGSKRAAVLGGFPLPVEVNRFGLKVTTRLVREACGTDEVVLRAGPDGQPYVTDGGHLLLDCHVAAITDAQALAGRLVAIPGVVEHGLFIGIAKAVVTDVDGAAQVVGPRP